MTKKSKNITNGEKTVSSTNGVQKNGQLHAKQWNQNCFHTRYTKIISQWIKDLNVRPETMELLQENIINKFLNISLSSFLGFLDLSPQARATKAKISIFFVCFLMRLYQTKNLLHNIGNHQQNKTATYWMGEDICKWYIRD